VNHPLTSKGLPEESNFHFYLRRGIGSSLTPKKMRGQTSAFIEGINNGESLISLKIMLLIFNRMQK